MKNRLVHSIFLTVMSVLVQIAIGSDSTSLQIRFNHDVRPILSENCFSCHGPDKGSRKGGLRLDTFDGATAENEGKRAIVPGNTAQSELYKRITSTDYEEHMPPAKTGHTLSEHQIAVLKTWIEQGAKWDKHWSFIPPQRPEVPKTRSNAGRNPIDQFIVARLEQDGLTLQPEADKPFLIRRASLDLTGLPPTLTEVDAFLADSSPDAYEKMVDRLLASPHYGERMALDWLDAARYADTHGYHIDAGRDMTRWREWVIEAFNENKPFDQFTVEQLAGDLLPGATTAQKIASGFNRNHMINFEGGAIPEEYHNAYLVDRVNTTSTVWLGLTVNCCQCHDHKYDPISQKEYYQLYAFFNNVPENGLDGSKGNAAPLIKAPTTEQQENLDRLNGSIRKIEEQIAASANKPEMDAEQKVWEASALADHVEWQPLDPDQFKSAGGATLAKASDMSIRVTGQNPATDTYTVMARAALPQVTAIRLEALPDDGLAAKGPGRSENGNMVLTNVSMSASSTANPAAMLPLKIRTANADFSQKDYPISNAVDNLPESGWAIHPETGKPHTAVFELDSPLTGSSSTLLTINLEFKSQFAQHTLGKFRLSVTGSRNPNAAALPANIHDILVVASEKRTEKQKNELRQYFRTTFGPKKHSEELAALKKEVAEIEKHVPSTMVMQEMASPRQSYLLIRGQYDQHGDKVYPGVPAVLPPLPKDAPANRLTLARWLIDPGHPLTARVIVNRYWQMYFGCGLVKTVEDFGSQGEQPSNPELLDWLATEFVQSGWNVKALQRLIVTSAAYRQSSAATKDLLSKDPENRLLSRGARLRLPAELIRDMALSVSGLLDGRIGGASVSPYQPSGLWEELMSRADGANWTAQVYVQSHGADLYRRTMYTFWKRSSPPPTLCTLDAPDREVCTVRRARTNTPLQALVLMNDPTYVESARKLAERVMLEGGDSPAGRIEFLFRLATARRPKDAESGVLQRIFQQQLAAYKKNSDSALKLLHVGEAPRNEKLDTAELAAWTIVASTVLNLDETITKE